jgi:hypothetical protein
MYGIWWGHPLDVNNNGDGKSWLKLYCAVCVVKGIEDHENSNKENLRNREPGCIYTIEYWIQLNIMRIVRVAHFSFITHVERQLCIVNRGYAIVTEQHHFSFITHVERQLCIVNGGYAIVTEQQWLHQTNEFRSISWTILIFHFLVKRVF